MRQGIHNPNIKLQTEVRRLLALKISLERRFLVDLLGLFNGIASDFRASVAFGGQATPAQEQVPPITVALDAHYRRVQNLFRGTVQSELGTDLSKLPQTLANEGVAETLSAALVAWRKLQATVRARIIADTNARQMAEAERLARSELIAQQEAVTNRSTAAAATPILQRMFRGRLSRIAQTETQNAAESTRLSEAEVLAGRVPFALTGAGDVIEDVDIQDARIAVKTWLTLDDEKVRPTHAAVNGVQVRSDVPFTVGTGRLMFPGDTSLAAPLSEIINCRCSALYGFIAEQTI